MILRKNQVLFVNKNKPTFYNIILEIKDFLLCFQIKVLSNIMILLMINILQSNKVTFIFWLLFVFEF